MPIKGMTDIESLRPRWPVIGKLRKGGEKETRNGREIYGKDLDHFRFTSDDPRIVEAFNEAFGATPRALTVLLPYATLDDNFPTWIEAWNASALLFRTDGENCVLWLDEKSGKYSHAPKPYTPDMGGAQIGRLNVIIPELLPVAVGVVTLETHSINDIVHISNTLAMAEAEQRQHGRDLSKMLFTIRRVQDEISVPAFSDKAKSPRQRVKKWMVHIQPTQQWAESRLAISADETQHKALPVPEAVAEIVYDVTTAEPSQLSELEIAKAFTFKTKAGNKPLSELEDNNLEWIINNVSGEAASYARLVLADRKQQEPVVYEAEVLDFGAEPQEDEINY